MNHKHVQLVAGLYLVATPIGNARDITLRALDTLASADVIAAEDTRTARKLLEIHGVPLNGRRMIAYHDHSTERVRTQIADLIREGKSVAYVSEAGTPMISDPGYQIARAVRDSGGSVTTAPGPAAVIAALSLSGIPTDRFLFLGFLPSNKSGRVNALREVAQVDTPLVLYESPKRVRDLLNDLIQSLGETRQIALCRELTKKFEETLTGTAEQILEQLDGRDPKGECVVVVGRPDAVAPDETDIQTALREALKTMRMKDAATAVAGSIGIPRREVYQMALELEQDT